MKTINLLPKEAKKRDIRGLFLNIFLVVFAIVFILILLLSIFLYDLNSTLTAKINDYEMINMQIENDLNKVRIYEDFVKQVDDKEEQIDALEKFEQSWYTILMEFSKNINANTYITYIDGKTRDLYEYLAPDDNGEEKDVLTDKVIFFTVEGYTKTYNDVLRLMINAEDIPGTGEVWLNNISMDTVSGEGIEAFSFVITVYWDLTPFADEVKSGNQSETIEKDIDEGILQEELLNQ